MLNSRLVVLLTAALCASVLLYSPVLSARSQDSADTENDGPEVSVTISGVEGELLTNVQGFLPLYGLDGKRAKSAGRVRFLHSQADDAIRKALAPYGYYKPDISETLEEVNGVWQASYTIVPGEQLKLTEVDIRISGEAETDKAFLQAIAESPLKPGVPLLHQDYEMLKQRLEVLASSRGYFDAKLRESAIRINLERYTSTIRLFLDSGRRYALGEVSFEQDTPWLDEKMLERYSEIDPGQPYLADDLQQLQGDLANTEYFREVVLDVSPENADENRVIPVEVSLTARNPMRYTLGVGYGTDTGARVKAGLVRRRINQAGHQLTGEMMVSQYINAVAGEYLIPASDPRTDTWGLRGLVYDEDTDTTDLTKASIGGFFRHRDGLWIKTYALDYLVEQFVLESGDDTSRLLLPSIDWTRTDPAGMDERIMPDFGTRLQLSVRGAAEGLLSDTDFIQPLIRVKGIYSFSDSLRLIARGAAGTTSVSDFDKLPMSLRFLAGGDKSVRGYGYNVIGPRLGNDVVGGKHLLETSLELEMPLTETWSLATFIDAGDAFTDSPDYQAGVGVGFHWRSPIGPVRLDLGHAIDGSPGRKLRGHLTIGADL
ncbi:MAG: hypothetical protein CSB44_09350 [Gammaproteobacteria bacterium]|nr:MAG: hypothetical protein CSB44_09350 [Gammaproteobacteria bacterium]